MRRLSCLGFAAALLFSGAQAWGQSVLFDFETGTDQGWGHKFGDDASETFPIVNIGGSNRLEVLRNNDFQEAEYSSGNVLDPFYLAMTAATANTAGYKISYDWYVDTSAGNMGNFLQLGTYLNSGDGTYTQDFGSPKEVELDGAQLGSGQVFSGTAVVPFTKFSPAIPAGNTFFRLGLIINGDGAAKVYFDNVQIMPVPEPATVGLAAASLLGLTMIRRRK